MGAGRHDILPLAEILVGQRVEVREFVLPVAPEKANALLADLYRGDPDDGVGDLGTEEGDEAGEEE